jgi:hypothetical protein
MVEVPLFLLCRRYISKRIDSYPLNIDPQGKMRFALSGVQCVDL